MAVPALVVGSAVLVILGAVIIDRGRSATVMTSPRPAASRPDLTAVAGPERPGTTADAGQDTSTSLDEVRRDLCQLLTVPIARSIIDLDWKPEDGSGTTGQMGEDDTPITVSSCNLDDRHDEVDTRVGMDLFQLDDGQQDGFMVLEPMGDENHEGDRRHRVDSALHEEAVPSLPEGRIVWCACAAPSEDMRVEWAADGHTWWLSLDLWYLNLRLYRERPGIEGHREAMVAAAEEINDLILQGAGYP